MATGYNKWLFVFFIPLVIHTTGTVDDDKPSICKTTLLAGAKAHPLHVSVTEINHNAADKTLEISCKLFTDDFEKVLTKNYKTKADLVNPKGKAAMEKLVNDFVLKHLVIRADGKPAPMLYIGFEKDDDVVYSYFRVDNIGSVKKMEITNNLLHEMYTDQVNLMHIIVGGKRKSTRLDYPETKAEFNF